MNMESFTQVLSRWVFWKFAYDRSVNADDTSKTREVLKQMEQARERVIKYPSAQMDSLDLDILRHVEKENDE